MPVEKGPRFRDAHRRPFRFFPNGRTGFKAFLRAVCRDPGDRVLLPAYVGWSSREGSGVFDPVRELGLPYAFCRVDEKLRLDLGHMEDLLRRNRVKVVVLIHYFGGVDPGYPAAVSLARRHGALVLEDEAHALLTDLVGGASGRLGDACIFSLHKMLPMERGGMLVVNPSREDVLKGSGRGEPDFPSPWEYDLKEISCRRLENARILSRLLAPLAGEADPLWGDPPDGQVPQTYPVLIQNRSREQVYFSMNEAGFGVVSLYHTLIDPITPEEFPASHYLSRHILNLPVHQDARPDDLAALVDCLGECLRRAPGAAK